MPRVDMLDVSGSKVGEIDLSDAVFGVEPNEHLVHTAVRMHLANARSGTADTKTRSEVSGGGKKPWRQKGTGRARHGSIRSPLWRKGGIVFGPHPRDYGFDMPKKARRLALKSALSSKVSSGEMVVLNELNLEAPKTKEMAAILSNIGASRSALIVTANRDETVTKSTRNLEGIAVSTAREINVYDVVSHDKLVMTREAVSEVEGVLGR
ncbi:MAG: 50S ribosomal protein L4 [Firmicutes bacterium]|jgi:large subunit ribosomal protein L4|nr:50S ribosomal protein L4 [Bacillota bacterium]